MASATSTSSTDSAPGSAAEALAAVRSGLAYLAAMPAVELTTAEQADPFTNTVAVTIGRLRRKLGDPPVIATSPGVGYRITPTAD